MTDIRPLNRTGQIGLSVDGGRKAHSLSQAERTSREKLGALVRGHLVRNHTVLPSRIHPFLEKQFVGSPSEEQITSQMAILICRQINEKLARRSNAGKSFLITSLKGNICSENTFKKAETALKVDLWMTLSKEGNRVSLQFKPKDALFLGKGSYREVFAAEEINLEMQPTKNKNCYSRKTTKTPSVRVNGVDDQLSPSSSSYERVERGVTIHKKAFLHAAAAKKKGLLQEVYLTAPHELLIAGITKQERYQADMAKLLKKGTLAQDFSPQAKEVPITRIQMLQCARDVASALKWLNAQGITHRDGKLENVNVSWGKDHQGTIRPIAYLADFDFAKKEFGYDPLAFSFDYYAWDACSSIANVATPYTDLYGAAMILCNVMAPTVSWRWFDDTKKAIQQTVEKGEVFQPHHYLPQELDEHQQKAFAAFCGICYESSLLLEELKKVKGFPESIREEHVLASMEGLQRRNLLQHSMDSLIALIDLFRNYTQRTSKVGKSPCVKTPAICQ